MDFNNLARLVVKNMRIGLKNNPFVNKAKNKYGGFITDLMNKRTFKLNEFTEANKDKIKILSRQEWGPLVYKKNELYYTRPKIGETIRIGYYERNKECVKLAKAIRNECWRIGCYVQMIPANDSDTRKFYLLSPDFAIVGHSRLIADSFKRIDATIMVGYQEDPLWSRGLHRKIKLAADSNKYIQDIKSDEGIRWCWLAWPAVINKKKIYIPWKEYYKIFLEAIAQTYTSEVVQLVDYYASALEGADEVRITANDGTDLSFSIKGRPVIRSDGTITDSDLANGNIGQNIPTGEAFVSPLETTANGKIKFDFMTVRNGPLIRNLWMTFKNGKIINFEADDNKSTNEFQSHLDRNTGDKDIIAELGIGCNQKAKFTGTTLLDEKIFGTIHIAIGNNSGSYHGNNSASNHDDMIKIMRGNKGNIYVDGKLIMKDGLPVGLVKP